MKLSLNIFFFGQTLPTPLISTSFNGIVALGKNVAIFCRSQDNFWGKFYLTRFTRFQTLETIGFKETSNQAEFSFSLSSKSQGGMYNCRICLYQGPCSSFSDSIYLNVTDHSLSKPSIKVLNRNEHPYFLIWCEGTQPSLTFALIDSRQQIDYKAAVPGQNGMGFFRHSTRLKEVETYTCRYHLEDSPFVWSLPSEPLELPLKDPEMMNPTKKPIFDGFVGSVYLWAGIGVSIFLIFLLLLAVILYRKKRKRSKTKEHNPPMNKSSDVEEHPDEVSYAILNHQPQKTQQAANPRQTSELCLYATVVQNTSFQPYVS
ncbi:leukocyte immunoglobulin-like receptor subfamily B member 4A isoform X2 [Erythrolamprus reginae]|uniref:leukocyte immunoglobulin-like receptor subfamily B member 4A isoform X2 n=1 Tax=Erythrolamprus reginae TaxID=121349 RepID=UPI00396C57C9